MAHGWDFITLVWLMVQLIASFVVAVIILKYAFIAGVHVYSWLWAKWFFSKWNKSKKTKVF